MKYIGTNANRMIPGDCTPASSEPPDATMKPRLAAREYAGAVEAMPTTTLPVRPSTPLFRPLLLTAFGLSAVEGEEIMGHQSVSVDGLCLLADSGQRVDT